MKTKQVLLLFLLVIFQTPCAHAKIKNKTKQQDFRCKFFDLSRGKKNRKRRWRRKNRKKPRSSIIQFYSSMDNIGNYLPVLGIQKMLGCTPDTCCIHSRHYIDFNFINKHYKCAIIGGAGLLDKCFEPFWRQLLNKCKIPIIMWGIGVCLPDNNKKGVDKEIVSAVAQKCSLINVRDTLTAHYYNLKNASIAACPSIVYLQNFYEHKKQKRGILYSFHNQIVSAAEHRAILKVLRKEFPNLMVTDNIQTKSCGLDHIIKGCYCTSNLVITTRLHGAIIAYGLGIPYIIIARDEKLRSFHQRYNNGFMVESIEELQSVIKNQPPIDLQPIEYEPVLEFGRQAREWVEEQLKT
ncbi:MAG TPA: polysaccharide pyruvyl transferase family protein [Candidatus Dependentiae bacterium]|nr:polysaccharide pyruvyl transferase family protein [Candidatus Dependentiae bacterium]